MGFTQPFPTYELDARRGVLPEHGQMHDRVGRVFPPLHLAVNDAGVLPVSIDVVYLRHVATVRLTKRKSGIDLFSRCTLFDFSHV